LVLANALEKATPAIVEYTHPLTGNKMKIKILGAGSYAMQLPGNARMEVYFTPANAKKHLSYLRAMSTATEFSEGGDPIVNGEALQNPLEAAMQNDSGEVKLIEPTR
jgi:hypothetical protein